MMSKYGFNENEIVATKTVQIDKDGFHRIVDAANSGSGDLPLPTLYVGQGTDDDPNLGTIHSYAICALTKNNEIVYGTLNDNMYPMGVFAAFTDCDIDFTELPEGLTAGHINEFLRSKNVHYTFVSINKLMFNDSETFKNANTNIPISILSLYSESPNPDGESLVNPANAGYSWFLNANKNDTMQLYAIYIGTNGSIAIIKYGDFLWPYEKSISYNPDGALKASPASGEFNTTTGVTLNLEGTGKYVTTGDEIFISQTGFTGTVTDLSSCCSILSALDNTSQNITSANGFNTIDGTVTISGGFVEGENTLYVYGCTKDASNNWVIKESTTVKFNYAGNVI